MAASVAYVGIGITLHSPENVTCNVYLGIQSELHLMVYSAGNFIHLHLDKDCAERIHFALGAALVDLERALVGEKE